MLCQIYLLYKSMAWRYEEIKRQLFDGSATMNATRNVHPGFNLPVDRNYGWRC
jgi:hypothetical protein